MNDKLTPDPTRGAFEKSISGSFPDWSLERFRDGYLNNDVELSWLVWQAALASVPDVAPATPAPGLEIGELIEVRRSVDAPAVSDVSEAVEAGTDAEIERICTELDKTDWSQYSAVEAGWNGALDKLKGGK